MAKLSEVLDLLLPGASEAICGAPSLHYMGVSKNNGTPKSSILIGFSIINHPFWDTPIFGNTHMMCRFRFVQQIAASTKLRFHPDRHQLHNVQWQGFGLVTA